MSLFMKQDFTPPVLSRRWFSIKFRPNVLIHSRAHVISILESGLLFREDSVAVEQEVPDAADVWASAGGGAAGWLTRGETALGVVAIGTCLAVNPPKSLSRQSAMLLASYFTIPLVIRWSHRSLGRGHQLPKLLAIMRDYTALARRAAACLRECSVLCKDLSSMSSLLESLGALLCRQQGSLAVSLSRASSAVLGNVPWTRGDVSEAIRDAPEDSDLTKIHHMFLVVQSTFLKHVAMAHYVPSVNARRIYKNHNERIYWIHTVLLEYLKDEYRENYESLDRMYRLLKNYGNKDFQVKKELNAALKDSWFYSEVHADIARTNLELKIALEKCSNLDIFLDNCSINKQNIDMVTLNTDLDDILDKITKSLTTLQSSQLKLKKLVARAGGSKINTSVASNELSDSPSVQMSDVKEKSAGIAEPETRDEVFYFVKTDDDSALEPVADVSTGPGKKEIEATEVVLSELKRKLVKREDLMRERERQALINTMPELNFVPEFPRQIAVDESEKKGFLTKLKRNSPKRRLFKKYEIKTKSRKPKLAINKKIKIKPTSYKSESDLTHTIEVTKSLTQRIKSLITLNRNKDDSVITLWYKKHDSENEPLIPKPNKSENIESVGPVVKNESENNNSGSIDSSSDSEFEKIELLKDIRRHRCVRKKNFPAKSVAVDNVDESLKPIEYSFGTGMAMASVLQKNNFVRNIAQEEVFIGDGEVSDDSGNEESV